MIASAVTVSLVREASGGPFIFWHDLPAACRDAAALGFDAVEVFAPNPESFNGLDGLLSQHRLRLAAAGTGAGWLLHKHSLSNSSPLARCRAVDFVRGFIDAAAPFQAPVIIGSMQGRAESAADHEPALGRLAESLGELAAHAAAAGTRILIEPLNRYETDLLNRLDQAAALIQGAAIPSVQILADLFHMNIEETSIPAALATNARFIGHVHFVDSNRHAPGFGHLDFRPILRSLTEAGFGGFLSAEALPLPDSSAAAAQTVHAFRQLTRAAGIDNGTGS